MTKVISVISDFQRSNWVPFIVTILSCTIIENRPYWLFSVQRWGDVQSTIITAIISIVILSSFVATWQKLFGIVTFYSIAILLLLIESDIARNIIVYLSHGFPFQEGFSIVYSIISLLMLMWVLLFYCESLANWAKYNTLIFLFSITVSIFILGDGL